MPFPVALLPRLLDCPCEVRCYKIVRFRSLIGVKPAHDAGIGIDTFAFQCQFNLSILIWEKPKFRVFRLNSPVIVVDCSLYGVAEAEKHTSATNRIQFLIINAKPVDIGPASWPGMFISETPIEADRTRRSS